MYCANSLSELDSRETILDKLALNKEIMNY